MELTGKQQLMISGLSAALILFSLIAIDDYTRRGGIPKDKKMTLIKKEILTRKVDPCSHDYGEGYLPSEKYVRLSFDTDGDTNTVEATAVPAHAWWQGMEEVQSVNIGEDKTLSDWNQTLEKVGSHRKTTLPSGEERDRTALFWVWENVR